MKKKFNTTGLCLPERHYMADTSENIQSIIKLVEDGDFFVINRARQYGKTTTLHLLAEALKDDYTVFSLSFEGMGDKTFEAEGTFCSALYRLMEREIKFGKTVGVPDEIRIQIQQSGKSDDSDFVALTDFFLDLCHTAEKPVVLMIDEVDQASNYKSFLDFLGVLRNNYLQRNQMPSLQSVILAGVYDIKNLKLKIRPDGEHQFNSPWNIAADFMIDMSLQKDAIAKMLEEYDEDYQVGMDTSEISELIYDYTAGYPYMVSRICKLLDEKIEAIPSFENRKMVWTKDGVLEAVKMLLQEQNTLFDDMQKKLSDFPELKKMLYQILFKGSRFSFETNNVVIELGMRFGFLKNNHNTVEIANRIFETKLYNIFISEEETDNKIYDAAITEKNQFIINGQLSMELVMKKFFQHFSEIYADSTDKFIEENGRRIFLIYLKPIINGVGNYYIEARTRNMKRTDVIIDYRGMQSVVEMKIWHGEEYNRRGELQLSEYLEYYHLKKGYLLSFNFNQKKKTGIQTIAVGEKHILEVVV